MAAKAGQTADDPKALIYEAFRIEGISESQCRTIFLDWALSLPATDHRPAIERLLGVYGQEGHPMDKVLREGLAAQAAPRRRGGRAARVPD